MSAPGGSCEWLTVGLAIDIMTYPDVLKDREFIRKNASPACANRLPVAGAKMTIDGSPQGFTAWRDQQCYQPVGSCQMRGVGKADGHRVAVRWQGIAKAGARFTTTSTSASPGARPAGRCFGFLQTRAALILNGALL